MLRRAKIIFYYVIVLILHTSIGFSQSAIETLDFLKTYYRFIPRGGDYPNTEIYWYDIEDKKMPELFVINECIQVTQLSDKSAPQCDKVEQTGIFYKNIKSIEYKFQPYKRIGYEPKNYEGHSIDSLLDRLNNPNAPPKMVLKEILECWVLTIKYKENNKSDLKSVIISIDSKSGELFVERLVKALNHFTLLSGGKLVKKDLFDK